jgi:hypothetical protein
MTTTLSGFGITIDQLPGWYGEIFRTEQPVDSGPILHIANTPLILADRQPYAPAARERMRAGDAILCVVNFPSLPNILAAADTERLRPGQPWSLQGASDVAFSGVDSTHSSLRKAVRVADRAFDLIVFFGSTTPVADAVRDLEAMLKTMRIDVAPSTRGGRIEQYFSVADAVRTQDALRREIWARESNAASAEEVAEHQAAFPG